MTGWPLIICVPCPFDCISWIFWSPPDWFAVPWLTGTYFWSFIISFFCLFASSLKMFVSQSNTCSPGSVFGSSVPFQVLSLLFQNWIILASPKTRIVRSVSSAGWTDQSEAELTLARLNPWMGTTNYSLSKLFFIFIYFWSDKQNFQCIFCKHS